MQIIQKKGNMKKKKKKLIYMKSLTNADIKYMYFLPQQVKSGH